MSDQQYKTIILDGFSRDEIVDLMALVKKRFPKKGEVIFAMTTPNSLKMTVQELLEELTEDHRYMQANPPSTTQKEQS